MRRRQHAAGWTAAGVVVASGRVGDASGWCWHGWRRKRRQRRRRVARSGKGDGCGGGDGWARSLERQWQRRGWGSDQAAEGVPELAFTFPSATEWTMQCFDHHRRVQVFLRGRFTALVAMASYAALAAVSIIVVLLLYPQLQHRHVAAPVFAIGRRGRERKR
uniref:Uncharacterized protein n=1 Tax=Oryza glaberrima TaxID=4538 RepID=A0A679BB38_ORYGL|nr:hypothetical protein [Oryza glaberrima]